MRRYLIAVPVLLTIHNAEEAWGGLARLRPVLAARLPSSLAPLLGSDRGWMLALVTVTLVPWVALLFGDLGRRDSAAVRLLVIAQAVMTLNVLSHVGGTLLTRSYVPGVLTAVLLYVPFAARFFPLARREMWVNRRLFAWLPAIAVALHGPVLVGLLAACAAVMAP
jgi:hypothetical protein